MWWLIFCLWQEPQVMAPEPLNAQIFLDSGERIDLAEIRIKGLEPFAFEFNAKGESFFISLYRVSRITRREDGRTFDVLLDSGELLTGGMRSIAFTGNVISDLTRQEDFNLHQIRRIQVLSGSQLRSCLKGHYELYTPYPFCPVCGDELVIGPFPEELPEEEKTVAPPLHRLRLDPRDPQPPATGTRRQ